MQFEKNMKIEKNVIQKYCYKSIYPINIRILTCNGVKVFFVRVNPLYCLNSLFFVVFRDIA